MHLEQEAVCFADFSARVERKQRRSRQIHVQVSRNRHVPAAVDAAFISNPVGDAVRKGFAAAPTPEFDIFIRRGSPCYVPHEGIDLATCLFVALHNIIGWDVKLVNVIVSV